MFAQPAQLAALLAVGALGEPILQHLTTPPEL
jgi:hypothetical protein